MKQHINNIHKKKREACKICQKTFSSLSNLSTHIKETHGSEKIYKCDICDIRLTTSNGLKGHLNRFHKEVLSDKNEDVREFNIFDDELLLMDPKVILNKFRLIKIYK